MAKIELQLTRLSEVLWTAAKDLSDVDPIKFVPYNVAGHNHVTDGISYKATACVYCGSTVGLTKEHIIPYGLNGTGTIANGSCEKCQQITHKFEAAILQGDLQDTRFKLGMSSRRKHKKFADSNKKAGAAIVTAFPVFPLPNYFGERSDNCIRLDNVQVVGSDYRDLQMNGHNHIIKPVEFACLIAKIGYCFAWSIRLIDAVVNASELVDAFMRDPKNLGKFVGTRRPPYRRASTPGHSLTVGSVVEKRVAFVNVQLLAERGTPTYIVALGEIKKGWSYRTDAETTSALIE